MKDESSSRKTRFGRDFVWWYRDEETHARFKPIFKSDDTFPQDHARWLREAQKMVQEAAEQGIVLIKVNADPDEFAEWCRLEKREFNRQARSVYAFAKGSQGIGRG